jgi:hypothetical protein
MFYLTGGSVAATFVKKSCSGEGVEAILQTLERLTQDEARMTIAEILQVAHDLVRNINMVIDGEKTHSTFTNYPRSILLSRGQATC